MAVQGAFMLFCTGRFIQITPEGSGLVMAANLWNTLILLLFIPLVAILLISGHYLGVDLSHVAIGSHLLLLGIEAAGILLILFGTVLVVLGFLVLRKNFQPGGFVPRESDQLATSGIFSVVQHPLYGGVLSMTLGLILAVQSILLIVILCIHLFLVLKMIPLEEKQLAEKFGGPYVTYKNKVKRFIPYIY